MEADAPLPQLLPIPPKPGDRGATAGGGAALAQTRHLPPASNAHLPQPAEHRVEFMWQRVRGQKAAGGTVGTGARGEGWLKVI